MTNDSLSHDQVLLGCLAQSSDQLARMLNDIGQSYHWEQVYSLAANHGVAALVYAHLKTLPSGAVLPHVMAQWQRYDISQRLFNHRLAVEMNNLLRKFADAKIPALVFKGPPLAWQLYGNIYARPYMDIDFWVPSRQTIASSNLLVDEGYLSVHGTAPQALPRLGYHFNFMHPKRRVEIELHWSVAPAYLRFQLDFEQVWENAIEVEVLNRLVRTPSLIDTFLILCMHGTKHGWVRLSWISDIAAFVTNCPEFDWQFAIERANKLRCKRMLLLALHLTHTLLNVQIPRDAALAITKDSRIHNLATEVRKWIFTPVDSHYYEKHAFQIYVREGLVDKYLYIKVKQPLLDDQASEQTRKPQSDRGLYYLLWIISAFRKRVLRPLQRIIA
jgi:hypothetical protein